MTGGHALAELERMLAAMLDRPDAEDELAAAIDHRFGCDAAILTLDMSGFSRTTRQRGIVAFLLMIQRMKQLAGPAITVEGGEVVKAEADNLYCLFPDVPQALRAAGAILRQLDEANLAFAADRCIYAAIGIGFGRILHIPGEDLFGDQVNLACKLGEDVAQQGEVLLTAAAAERVPGAALQQQAVVISGLDVPYRRWLPTPA
jgi:class 3 adenylate cyclase